MEARVHDLPELGYEYFDKGITLKVVGWNARARKYPIILKGSDGRKYKSSVTSLRMAVAANAG